MPTITLKGLPDEIYHALKARAVANRRSLNSEVLVCLEQSVAPPAIDVAGTLARVDALRARMEQLGLPPLTDEVLAAAKNEGRP